MSEPDTPATFVRILRQNFDLQHRPIRTHGDSEELGRHADQRGLAESSMEAELRAHLDECRRGQLPIRNCATSEGQVKASGGAVPIPSPPS